MKSDLPDPVRRVLPRWRAFSTATQLGELNAIVSSKNTVVDPAIAKQLAKLVADFEEDTTIDSATELLNGSFVLGAKDEFTRASEFLQSLSGVPPAISQQIEMQREKPADSGDSQNRFQQIREFIISRKSRVRAAPRDAISWTELARGYCMYGQTTKCREALNIALALAPDNRYVLRSAARFFIHDDDPERSSWILRNSSRTRFDPWLIAAEISCSSIAQQTSKFMRTLKNNPDNRNWSSRDQAELHSSAATTLAASGNTKQAKKLLRLSIRDPNENAYTQAEWARIRGWGVTTNQQQATALIIPEALALRAREEGKWDVALERCMDWYCMEPTSTRPLRMATFICLVALEDGERALTFLNLHHMLEPHNGRLFNDFSVAHGYSGNLESAKQSLKRSVAASSKNDYSAQVVNIATEGMLQCRSGYFTQGSELYSQAIKLAIDRKEPLLATQAFWHYLREASKVGLPNMSETVTLMKGKADSLFRIAPEYRTLISQVEIEISIDRNSKQQVKLAPTANALTEEFPWLILSRI